MQNNKRRKIKLCNFSPILFYLNYNQIAIALKSGYNCSHIAMQLILENEEKSKLA